MHTRILPTRRSAHIYLIRSQISRSLHATSSTPATPLPGVSSPGPPPKPPHPSPSQPSERIARARRKAELLELGKTLRANEKSSSSSSASNSGQGKPLLKRFWKNVSVGTSEDGRHLHVLLDGRPVRTTKDKRVLRIPRSKPHLATGVALEWEGMTSAQQALKSQYIPLTDLTSRALDIEDDDMGLGVAGEAGKGRLRETVVKMFMSYLRTDTLLCWAPAPSPLTEVPGGERADGEEGKTLRQTQIEVAKPIIAHLTTRIWPGVEVNPVLEEDSIRPTPQAEITQNVVRGWVSGLPPFELAGLERAMLATKSACIAARIVGEWSEHLNDEIRVGQQQERFGIEEAAKAGTLEVAWQTGVWGEVEDSHDVDKEDMRRQLGSVVLLVSSSAER